MCEDACNRLGQFRQPLGMAIVQLFDERGDRKHPEVRETILVNKLIRMNGDLSDEALFARAKTFLNDKDLSVRTHTHTHTHTHTLSLSLSLSLSLPSLLACLLDT
jgi:hypothetical protein